MKNLKYFMLGVTLLFGASIASAQGCQPSQIMNGGSINSYTSLSGTGTGAGTSNNVIADITAIGAYNHIATANAANSFVVGQTIAISGTTNGGGVLNGIFIITIVNPTQFAFNFTGANVTARADTGLATSRWNTLTQTTIADGYINYTPSEYCKVTGNPHYANITQTLGSTTHNVNGTYVCPSCQFHAQDTIVIVGVPGIIYVDVVTSSANCAAGGWHLVKKFLDIQTEWAGTWQQVLPNQPTYVWVGVIPFCSNTAPAIAGVIPDFNPNVAGPNVVPPTPIIFGLGYVERNVNFSRVWHQFGPAFFTDSGFLPTDPKPICTVTP